MTKLPISRMTLYKHGVGFFERRAELSGAQVTLSFRVEEMNDVLKSLTVIDWGQGRVLGVEYATPQSRQERLKGCSIRLEDDRSLRDLLTGLRGRSVRLLLDQEETLVGELLGLDEVAERQPLATSLVSLLLRETAQVQVVPLERVQGVEILDEQGAGDLRFFLQTALSQEEHRQVRVRLTPGEHDLSVSYIAPAPTWRVSYRLVAEADEALILGWGIFDNRLEEDLEGVSLSLVAGMPISFVYNLYTPFTPQRPEVEEPARVAAAPVEFEQARAAGMGAQVERLKSMTAAAAAPVTREAPMAAPRRRISREALEKAAPVEASGEALGELFQYVIETPVTVGRGQSAMVPILSADLDYGKDLLYNGAKLETHPVATLRLTNETGLTLERGPVTVIERGTYAGEAILPFTSPGGEVVVPYAVELGVKVREQSGTGREVRGLQIQGAYLQVEEWDLRWREYQLSNSTSEELEVLVEHPRTARFALYDTPEPRERTDEQWRFEVPVPAHDEVTFRIQERRLRRRREKLQQQSFAKLQRYLRKGLMDQAAYEQAAELLERWEKIQEHRQSLEELEQERQKIYQAQNQIQGNMGALSTSGKEGTLRARYVDQLRASERQLETVAERETALQAEIERLEKEIQTRIEALE